MGQVLEGTDPPHHVLGANTLEPPDAEALDGVGTHRGAIDHGAAHRVLGEGGIFVVSFHEGDGSVLHRDEWYGKPIDISVKIWPKAEVDAALVQAGFTIESSLVRETYEGELFPRLYVTATA